MGDAYRAGCVLWSATGARATIAAVTEPNAPGVVVRLLASDADYQACLRLQRETWGEGFGELVPASILKITNRIGGIVAGAFLQDELAGFVYGLTGLDAGRAVQWSHMLAVRPAARDRGIGRRLKEFQLATLAARGIRVLRWSFDPLVARNAHLNLSRLGARVDRYVVDMYPTTGSRLHSFGTDRLLVTLESGDEGAAVRPEPAAAGPAVRIEIPQDIEAIAGSAPGDARAWRERTRAAFLDSFARGLAVLGFTREPDGRCFYTLAPASDRADPGEVEG